jgi:hypothetical protein
MDLIPEVLSLPGAPPVRNHRAEEGADRETGGCELHPWPVPPHLNCGGHRHRGFARCLTTRPSACWFPLGLTPSRSPPGLCPVVSPPGSSPGGSPSGLMPSGSPRRWWDPSPARSSAPPSASPRGSALSGSKGTTKLLRPSRRRTPSPSGRATPSSSPSGTASPSTSSTR